MKPHLLLIDDDKDELRILSDTLDTSGIECKCTWATSPEQALEMLQYLQVDLIFVDYNMPKMNGIECIRFIKKIPVLIDTPIILYSSQVDADLVKRAIDAGARSCLKKTHDTSSLVYSLQEIFATSFSTAD